MNGTYPQSMEKWLDAFQRDANPESEVRWWERAARCYMAYCDTKELTAGQKRAAFGILFAVAMGLQPKDAEVASAKNALQPGRRQFPGASFFGTA